MNFRKFFSIILIFSAALNFSLSLPPSSLTRESLATSSKFEVSSALFEVLSQELTTKTIDEMIAFVSRDPEVADTFNTHNFSYVWVIPFDLRMHIRAFLAGLIAFPDMENRIARQVEPRLIPWLRLIYLLHDAGKMARRGKGDKSTQGTDFHTLKIIDRVFQQWGVPESIGKVAHALIESDPEWVGVGAIGSLIRNDMELKGEEAVNAVIDSIIKRARMAEMSVLQFFELYSIYFAMDAATYPLDERRIFAVRESKLEIIHPRYVELKEALEARVEEESSLKEGRFNAEGLPSFAWREVKAPPFVGRGPSVDETAAAFAERYPSSKAWAFFTQCRSEMGFYEGPVAHVYRELIEYPFKFDHQTSRPASLAFVFFPEAQTFIFRFIYDGTRGILFVLDEKRKVIELRLYEDDPKGREDPPNSFWLSGSQKKLFPHNEARKSTIPLSAFHDFKIEREGGRWVIRLTLNQIPRAAKELLASQPEKLPAGGSLYRFTPQGTFLGDGAFADNGFSVEIIDLEQQLLTERDYDPPPQEIAIAI